jgi:hypothetical protein
MGTVTAIRSTPAPAVEWLSPAQVCDLLPGMTEEILTKRRKKRLDPPYFKPTGEQGKVVLYDRADVVAWVNAHRVETRAGVA